MLELGSWTFNEITIEDMNIYSEYIKATEYPANLWSSNFPYLWASSQSTLRKVLWKVVDEMLVTFGHSYKNSLYLFCLPYGKGNPEEVTDVLYRCMRYCFDWNNQQNDRTFVKMINDSQLEFLRNCSKFDEHFRLVTWQGIERHYGIKNLVSLAGPDFSNIRNRINKFNRENPNAILRRYKPSDFDALIELGNHWSNSAGKKYSTIFDKVYYREIIKHCDEFNQIILVIEIDGKIVGMITGAEMPTGQAWGSLLKYEQGIPGLSEMLSVEIARKLNKTNPNIELLNVGSDLGAGGLRDYKLKFRPVLNLKRYQIYLK